MAYATKSERRSGRRGRVPLGLGALAAAVLVATGLAAPAFADETYATWEDVVAAQGNVDRAQALITEIQNQISSLDADVATADEASRVAGDAYGDAMTASAEKSAEVQMLQQQADEATATAEASAEQAGRLAAAMATRSGGNPELTLLSQPQNADNLLYQLGTISKLSAQTDGIYQEAVTQKNTATSLGEQAQAALDELQVLETDAKTKFDAAQRTQLQLQAQKSAANTQRAELQAMLGPLTEQRDVTAADYQNGQRFQQEQLERENRERAEAAAAAQEKAYEEAVADAERAGVEPPAKPDIQTEAPPVVVPDAPQVDSDGTLVDPETVPEPAQSETPTPAPTTAEPVATDAPQPTVDPVPAPQPKPSIDPFVPPTKPDIEVVPEPTPEPEPQPADGVAAGYAGPIDNAVVTDEYGMRYHPISGEYRMHWGLDLGVNGGTCGAPLKAVHAGTVTYAGYNGGYGNHIVLDIGGGVTVSYSHIMEGGINVVVGQWVNAGDVLAYAGTTGSSTGCHLHFEVMNFGENIDPKPWLAGLGIYYY